MPEARPRDVIEIAWPNNPWDTSLTWVDETPRLLAVTHEWGRTDRDGDVRVATLEATLDNSDGRYTQQWAPNGTDLLTNGTFADGLTAWSTFGSAVTVIDGDGWNGVRSIELADTDPANTGPAIFQPFSPTIPVTPGETIWLSVHARQVVAGNRGSLGIQAWWQDATRTTIEQLLTSEWARYDIPIVIPAGKTAMRIWLVANRVQSADTGTIRVSAVRLMREVPGPYPQRWPYVRPRRPIRWRRFYDGVWHQRFEGFITALPTAWDGFATGTCVIKAAGRMGLLADVDLPDTVWEHHVGLTNPRHWYRLDEGAKNTFIVDSGSARMHGTNYPPLPEDVPPPPLLAGTGKRISAGARINGVTPLIGTNNWTIAVAAHFDLTRPAEAPPIIRTARLLELVGTTASGGVFPVHFLLEMSNALVEWPGFAPVWSPLIGAILGDPAGSPPQAVISAIDHPNLSRSGWFLIVVRRQAGVLKVRCEGVEAQVQAPYSLPSTDYLWLRRAQVPSTTTIDTVEVDMDEVLIWDRAFTDGEVAQLESEFTYPWRGHSGPERATAILDAIAVPAAFQDAALPSEADPGATLARTQLGGKALTYLRRIAQALRGSAHDTVDGKIRITPGSLLLAPPYSAVQATFGQEPGDLPYVKLGVDPSYDRIVNDVTASTVEGTPQRHVDSASVTAHGARSPRGGAPRDLLLGDEAQAYSWASWRVHRDKDPSIGIDPLVLHPLGHHELIQQVLQRRLDDRIRVRRRLPGGVNVVDAEVRIAGGREVIARGARGVTWSVEWRLEPVDRTAYAVADGTRVADGATVAY